MLETSTPSSSLINLLYGEDDDEKVRPPLTIQLPSSPRPTHRAVKPKRASSIVRSPYLAAVAPPRQSVVPRHSPSTKRSSPVKATQVYKNGLFVPIKRKSASNKATDVDSTVDYAGKTALDLRDELTAMKKNLSATEEQRDIFRGELIKYKQLLVKKDKEIEDLIMSGHVSTRDRARINTGNKADVLLAMSSYKHRIHGLERSMRDKDELISTMERDVRRTRLKEMETEKETYYTEILRLQGLLEHMESEMNKDIPQSKKQLKTVIEERERTISEMGSKCKGLHSERDKLIKILGFWKENDKIYPSDDGRAQQYLSLSQGAAISALVQMESTVDEKSKEIEELREEMTTITQKHNEECKKFSDKIEEIEKRIKELETLEDKYKELTETHITLKDELNDTRESLKEEKLNVEKTQLLAATFQEAVETEKLARDYAQKLNKKRTQKQLMEKEELGRSATLIQQKWRQYHSKKRQLSFEKEQNELIQYLQSVLRGHTVRDQFLTHRERNTETNELTKTVQNILSGHYVRRTLLQQNER